MKKVMENTQHKQNQSTLRKDNNLVPYIRSDLWGAISRAHAQQLSQLNLDILFCTISNSDGVL